MAFAHIRLYTDNGEEIFHAFGFVPDTYVTGPNGQPATNTVRIPPFHHDAQVLLRLECTPVDPNR